MYSIATGTHSFNGGSSKIILRMPPIRYNILYSNVISVKNIRFNNCNTNNITTI